MRHLFALLGLALATMGATSTRLLAQLRKLQVVSVDSQPIVYALVTLEGANGQITDEKGEISLGICKAKTFSITVRRIGYQPWSGKMAFPESAAVLRVILERNAQTLSEVHISGYGAASGVSLPMRGFYERWQMRQKGLLSATFIGPEEIEFRHPNRITNLLNGLNGVSLHRSIENDQVAFGSGGKCRMAILVDGRQQCPLNGCMGGDQAFGAAWVDPLSEKNAVLLDKLLEASDVAAIEVYPRGGNMPVSLQAADASCGVIAFWTGSRRP